MTDELDNLTETDLAETFVREVLEKQVNDGVTMEPDASLAGAPFESWSRIPSFAVFADSVLRHAPVGLRLTLNSVGWVAEIPVKKGFVCSYGRSALRATCVAIIRARRAKKQEGNA